MKLVESQEDLFKRIVKEADVSKGIIFQNYSLIMSK